MTYTRDKEGYMTKNGVRDMRFKPLSNVNVKSEPTTTPVREEIIGWEADSEDEEDEDEEYEVIEKPKPVVVVEKKKRGRKPNKPKVQEVIGYPQTSLPKPESISEPRAESEESKVELRAELAQSGPPTFPSETFKMKSRSAPAEKRNSIEELSHMIRQRTMKLKF